MLQLIAAVSVNGVIGDKGDIPWKLPSDMRRFKEITLEKAVIMGRKTWESIPQRFRPLSNRQNIVVTRNTMASDWDCSIAHSLPDALKQANTEDVFIIGGFSLYKEGLALAEKLIITRVQTTVDGDTVFPDIGEHEWALEEVVLLERDAKDQFDSTLETYRRR